MPTHAAASYAQLQEQFEVLHDPSVQHMQAANTVKVGCDNTRCNDNRDVHCMTTQETSPGWVAGLPLVAAYPRGPSLKLALLVVWPCLRLPFATCTTTSTQ